MPVIVAGEHGMGRTTILARALEYLESEDYQIIRLTPSGERPLAALRASFPVPLPRSATLSDAVRVIARYAAGRRLVVAADDAHLMDDDSLLALRELSRRREAALLVTRLLRSGPPGRPDPSECLSYEPGVLVLTLQPLGVSEVAAVLAEMVGGPVTQATAEAVHAATGGNPRLLRTLAERARLTERMTRHGGSWALAMVPPARAVLLSAKDGSYPGAVRLADATWSAWKELAVQRAHQLCQLALWCGIREEIAPVWASLLLFKAGAPAASEFLRSLPDETIVTTPPLALVTALTLTLGLDRTHEATDLLRAAAEHGRAPQLMLAAQAWLLAVTGEVDPAARALRVMERDELGTAVFIHATRAELDCVQGRRAEAVFHLRRALAAAECGSDGFPWIRPYLRASLIDALLLSGRAADAASLARRFHAHEASAGWDLAVALNALAGRESWEANCPVPA